MVDKPEDPIQHLINFLKRDSVGKCFFCVCVYLPLLINPYYVLFFI